MHLNFKYMKWFKILLFGLLLVFTVNAEPGFYNQHGLKLTRNINDSADYNVTAYDINNPKIVDVPSNTQVEQRWGRSWKIKPVNNVNSSIDIVFVFSNSGFNFGTASNSNRNKYVLLLETSNNTWSIDVQDADNVVNFNKVRFNDISLNTIKTITLGTLDSTGAPLPVELVYFDSELNNSFVHLEWKTVSETNNNYFILQRNFGHKWYNIDTVMGHGTTIEPNKYSYTDTVLSLREVYYRLKQVDYNSNYEYSFVISFKQDTEVRPYPNPVTDYVMVHDNYKLYNKRGYLIINGECNRKCKIDVSHLRDDYYILVVDDERYIILKDD